MASRYVKLTAANLKALAVGKRLSEHGIVAERAKDGDVRWIVNVMVDGTRIHRVIGRASEGVTRTKAEQAIETLRTKAREDRLALPKGRKLTRSFSDAATEYIARLEKGGGKDMPNKRRHLDRYLRPFFGDQRLNAITEDHLYRYRSHRAAESASAATINREMSTFLHLIRKAASKEWGWIMRDDIPYVPKEREIRKQIRVLSAEQCQRLIESAQADHDRDSLLFVLFGLNTAMRHGEIMSRRFDDIDFANNRIWIDKAKAGAREQPITNSLKEALLIETEKRGRETPWIFPVRREGAKLPHRRELGVAFARCVTRAGIDPKQCTPHVMRHTAITRLIKARIDIPTVKRISGHKTTAMVEHYTHIHGAHVDDAMATLDTSTAFAATRKLHFVG